MNPKEIINNLKKFRECIIKKWLEYDHWPPYFFITEAFNNDSLDNEFKRRFCRFYGMNGPMGLNHNQKDTFFELLSNKKVEDLERILRNLYEVPRHNGIRSLFLSFGTKLLHTVENNLPIYDRNIAHILNLPQQIHHGTLEERIENRVVIYNELKEDFELLLGNPEIKSYLKALRTEMYTVAPTQNFEWRDDLVSDTKLLDSALWALYSCSR